MLYLGSRKSIKARSEKNLFVCWVPKKTLGKIISLPSAKEKHSANLFLCRVPLTNTRQTSKGQHMNGRMSMWRFFCQVSLFYRVFFPNLPSGLFSALGKDIGMPSVVILSSVVSEALGKQLFCRVPDGTHSTNLLALDKSAVSGSDVTSFRKQQTNFL